MQRHYWQFYWPLALTGIALVLAAQFQNATLARYPNAVSELAIYAIAASTYGLFQAMLGFVPQMSNVFARSSRGHRVSRNFILCVCGAFLVPLTVLAWTQTGGLLIAGAFNISGAFLETAQLYLRYLTPLVILHGMIQFYIGKLVQCQLTKWVTSLNVIYLITVITMLVLGFSLSWPAVITLPLSQISGGILHLALAVSVHQFRYRPPVREEHSGLTYGEVLRFFAPVTITSLMFSLSRPVLYAFVSRMPDQLASIAAMRVAFDLSTVFGNAANQFRHFFVTFGLRHVPEMRRFMFRVAVGIVILLFITAGTPLSGLVFGELLGVEGEVLEKAPEVLLTLTLLPAVMITRNYFHGLLMVHRRTTGMAFGAILRLTSIFIIASGMSALGWLNHITAAAILLMSFVVETVVVFFSARSLARSDDDHMASSQLVAD